MRVHPAARAARPIRSKFVLAIALLSLGTACSDSSGTTAADGNPLSLDTRGRLKPLAVSVRDSSLTVGDTLSMSIPALQRWSSAYQQRLIIAYRSSNPDVVSIDSSGVLHAMSAGAATVTVRTYIGIGAVALTVESPEPASPPANDGPATTDSTAQDPSPADSAVSPPGADSAKTPPGTAPGSPAPPPADGPTVMPPVVTPPPTQGTMPSFTAPQLPQASVDVSYPSPSRSIRVIAGDNGGLQEALNAAVGGDEIVLPDGATFTGSFHLPNRADGGTVILRSATVPVAAHTRMSPSQGGSLATLRATSVYAALIADDGAHGWRVVGVRMQLEDNAEDNYGIVTIGSGNQTSVSQYPRDIILDRVIINGSTSGNTSRCLSMNGVGIAVVDSWLSECHANGRDAQAIAAWTSTGPLLIDNNHLEGSGQAILLGGSDPQIANVSPADVVIRHNHLFKPLGWAGRWTVKAAFEIKNAERVLFEGNVIENHWADAQVGFAILMQAVNQDSRAPWSTVRDITVRLNAIRNSRSGINLLSRLVSASAPVSEPSRRILLRDNSFENVGRDPVTGEQGRFVQLLDDLEDITILQNTFFGPEASNAVLFDGKPVIRLALSNNVFAHATYGILGSGAGEGLGALLRFAPASTVSGNVLPGAPATLYGTGNVFPSTLSLGDFVNASGGNYSLLSTLDFSVLNGARTGVDGTAVVNATAGVTAR